MIHERKRYPLFKLSLLPFCNNFVFQLPKDIIASIYKLVAERRDRNQSMRRKRNIRNISLFKDSVDEVQYRRPTLNRTQTIGKRTVSDQPHGQELQLPPAYNHSTRRSTSDMLTSNLKNQLKNVDSKLDTLTRKVSDCFKAKQSEKCCSNEEVSNKVETLAKKIDELTKVVVALRNELNKK